MVVQLDEDTLLAKHLEDAQGSLKTAYDALNNKHYSTSLSLGLAKTKHVSSDALSEFGSGGKRTSGDLSKKGSDDCGEDGAGYTTCCASDKRMRPARLLTKVRAHRLESSVHRMRRVHCLQNRLFQVDLLSGLSLLAAAVRTVLGH